MKTLHFHFSTTVLVALVILTGCKSQFRPQSKFKEKKGYENIFSLDAIIADQNYYNKAVLEYKVNQEVLSRFGAVYTDFDPEQPQHWVIMNALPDSLKTQYLIEHGRTIVSLFNDTKPNTPDSLDWKKSDSVKKNYNLKGCRFLKPEKLTDLVSGFTFKHYMFTGESKAAMQAFGISDSKAQASTLYLVTDYIQFRDCNCPGLPTIRYAVGLRSELRIESVKADSKLDVSKIGSLGALAANVELNQIKADFTLKTIGITGLEARMPIPKNTSFNVSTFSDFQNAIDFVRTMSDSITKNPTLAVTENVMFHPELIPVMDDYRTTFGSTYMSQLAQFKKLQKQAKKVDKKKPSNYSTVSDDIKYTEADKRPAEIQVYNIRLDAIHSYIRFMHTEQQQLNNGNNAVNNMEMYVRLLEEMKGLKPSEEKKTSDK